MPVIKRIFLRLKQPLVLFDTAKDKHIAIKSTEFRMCLTLLRGRSRRGYPSSIHQPLMGSYPSESIRFRVELFSSPHPFSKGTRTNPNLHMMDVLIAEFTPETDLCAKHILLVAVAFDDLPHVEVVHIHPGLVVAVAYTEIVADSHVNVERAVLGDDDFVGCGGKTSSPPVNHVSILDLDVVGIHPIDEFLCGV